METINRLKATVMYIIKERRAFIRPDFVPMQLLLYPNQVRLPNIPRVLSATTNYYSRQGGQGVS